MCEKVKSKKIRNSWPRSGRLPTCDTRRHAQLALINCFYYSFHTFVCLFLLAITSFLYKHRNISRRFCCCFCKVDFSQEFTFFERHVFIKSFLFLIVKSHIDSLSPCDNHMKNIVYMRLQLVFHCLYAIFG